jgi:hypothetical protein
MFLTRRSANCTPSTPESELSVHTTCEVLGRDLQGMDPGERVRFRGAAIGFVFQVFTSTEKAESAALFTLAPIPKSDAP